MLSRTVITTLFVAYAAAQAAAQVTVPPVLSPSDPSLRLWLKADAGLTLGTPTEGQPGPPVLQWQDQSQYGTILAPRTSSNPNGPIGGFPVEEQPHLVTSTLNGRSFPSIQFDRDGDIFETGDPAIDGSGSTDRLFQTNNLASQEQFDPLNIGDGSSLTAFIVFNPNVTSSAALGPHQSVFAKRGPNSSVYKFGITTNGGGRFDFVNYDANTSYFSGGTAEAQVWHTTALAIEDHEGAGGVDTLNFFDDGSQSDAEKMAALGVIAADGVTPITTIADRNASTPEPFAIGGHSQTCCGEGETFAGTIAEIIIFARTLTPQEFSDVENYLDAKYFEAVAGTPGDYNSDGFVDAADYTVFRDNLGSTFTLQNENPAAATPGVVDQEDYDFWKQNFGTGGGGALAVTGAVPEPTTLVLLVMGTVLANGFRRR